MMRSLFAGVSGLRVHQTKMDVIGNNIANVNTPGFKKSRTVFQEMLNQTVRGASSPQGNRGGTNPIQIGLGVNLGSIDVIHAPGSPQSTGKTLDMAIEGEGYFVVGEGSNRYYTRAGNFDFDGSNNLITSNGHYVLGWIADSENFQLQPDLSVINLSSLASKPINKATQNVEIGKNLDSRIPIQSGTSTFMAQISQEQINLVNPNDPSTYLSIQLPHDAVFDQNFSIGSIGYAALMANRDKWDFNPTTGELLLKDSSFPIDEIQSLNLGNSSVGSTFTLTLGTEKTDLITIGKTPDETARNIENALNNLNLGGGRTYVAVNGDGFKVQFTGGNIG
ncbi:MAG: flagellar hook-basal body complex protein, partial [Peptococcales bacterium]